MKFKELNTVNDQELDKKLDELEMSRMMLDAQRATGTTAKNPHELKLVRRTIARILTIKRQRAEQTKKSGEAKQQ